MQAKLTIGPVNDPLERDADAVSDRIMSMPEPALQPGAVQLEPVYPRLQAKTSRVTGSGQSEAPPAVQRVLRSPGQALDETARAFMEPRLGYDFSAVRVHTDSVAAESADAVSARAYTVGLHVVFASGRYAPENREGRRLLAHELAHVVQQSGAPGAAEIRREAASPETSNAPPTHDYKRLADKIYKAIAGLGTDEKAVYQALQELDRNQAAIEELKKTYLQEHKVTLLEDIYDDFSGDELEYALQLLNMGKTGSKQRLSIAPSGPQDVATAAVRIREAVEGVGTDEEAIFAVLLPFRKDTLELQNEYYRRYHEDLRERLVDEMSGGELSYALELLETPYEHYVQEGNEKLAGAPFGSFGDAATYCFAEERETTGGTKKIYWYDKDFWEPDVAMQEGRSTCKVKLLTGKSPADAIDTMFEHQDRWKIACAEFVQIVHLYALRHTLGKKAFDERVGSGFGLEVKRRASTGIQTAALFSRKGPKDSMMRADTSQIDPRPVDDILAAAPIGSRVRWTNLSGEGTETFNPWQNENTIKLGPNKFGAHGTATGIFTSDNTHPREEIELATARGTNPKADMSYVRANIFISEIEVFRDPSESN